MPAPILLGQSDFVSLREAGNLYVDKSGFVHEVLTAPAQVVLYPRPRRFGKTLNLSMAHTFFEIGKDRSALFRDLEIWSDASARAHFQRYPVIKLTFKDIKHGTWEEARAAIHATLSAEVARHRASLDEPRVDAALRSRLQAVLDGAGHQSRMLLDLSEALALCHGERAVVLIDEYDAGLLTAWERSYYDEAVAFFRSFLSAGLKDNPFLFKGVLTGILRVARESMFSGLNNVRVYSMLHRRPQEHFGFAQDEVTRLLDQFGRASQAEEVRRWYNGYHFGEATVYNPWSILCFLSEPGQDLQPWWLNTSENALVRALLLQATDLGDGIATLIGGGSLSTRIEEDIPLRELAGANIWSLLLFSGYLTATDVRLDRGRTVASLTIPNFEVRTLWEDTFLGWMERLAGEVEPLHSAILAGDAPRIEAILSRMVLLHVSTPHVAEGQDEAFYHAFMLGLLVTLEATHAVRSNREVGLGRADVQIIPKRPGLPGAVLEFKKRHGKKKLTTLATEALAQTDDRKYTIELEASGAAPIRRIGIAFSGKDVAVRAG